MSRRKTVDRRLAPKNPYGLPDNPKDLVGQNKLDTTVIPREFLVELALAFYEGALKYGRYNWRMRPVKASVYISAFDRHVTKWTGGEERDKKTGTHHFAYATCCLAILYDAQQFGTLIDDRPPRGRIRLNISAWIDGEVMKRIALLKELFKDENPKQFTINDDLRDDISPQIQRSSTVKRRTRSRRATTK